MVSKNYFNGGQYSSVVMSEWFAFSVCLVYGLKLAQSIIVCKITKITILLKVIYIENKDTYVVYLVN